MLFLIMPTKVININEKILIIVVNYLLHLYAFFTY